MWAGVVRIELQCNGCSRPTGLKTHQGVPSNRVPFTTNGGTTKNADETTASYSFDRTLAHNLMASVSLVEKPYGAVLFVAELNSPPLKNTRGGFFVQPLDVCQTFCTQDQAALMSSLSILPPTSATPKNQLSFTRYFPHVRVTVLRWLLPPQFCFQVRTLLLHSTPLSGK